jgi:hypothetical protein
MQSSFLAVMEQALVVNVSMFLLWLGLLLRLAYPLCSSKHIKIQTMRRLMVQT